MAHLLRKSITLTAFFSAVARAEPWTNATCTNPETTWTINSLQQSPCLVAAFLGAVCRPDNTWRIPALNGTEYDSYIAGRSNTCLCNSVIWSLLSACSLCQEKASSSWTTYSNGCTTADTSPPGVYPAAIPIGAAVPNWAYYDYVTAGAFNLAIARQQAGPESTAPPRPSSTTTPTSTAIASTTSSPTSAPANSSSGKSDTGAIVGGVVGGVLGIGLFALIAFYIVHKNKQKKQEQDPPATTQFDGANASYGQYPSGIQTSSFVPTTPSYKPYDPSDPSTFPTSSPNRPNVSDSVPNLFYQQNADTRPPRPNVPQL